MRSIVSLLLLMVCLLAQADEVAGPCASTLESAVAPLQDAIVGSCGTLMTYNKDTGRYDNKCPIGGPINPANGEVYLIHLPDFVLHSEGSEISFFRTYRSFSKESGAMGKGWRFNFEEKLSVSKDSLEYVDETGKANHFIAKENGSYSATAIPGAQLSSLAGNTGYRLDLPEGASHFFDAQGHLASIRFSSGQSLVLNYKAGLLSSVKDQWGRSIDFSYEKGLLHSVTAQNGSLSQVLMRYSYDSNGRLATARAADSTTESYSYAKLEVLGLSHYLETIHDGEGRVIEKHRYNEQGEGIYSSSKEGVFSLAFSDLNNHQRKVVVTDEATHKDSVMIYDSAGNQLSRSQNIGIPSARENHFDSQGRVTSQVQGETQGGVHTQMSYNGKNPSDVTQKAGADSRKTHFEYQHPHHLVTEVDYPSVVDPKLTKTTSFKYSDDRVIEQVVHGYTWDLEGKVVSFTDTTHYEYDSSGRMTKITDPSEQETLFSYYGADAGLDSGRLKSLKRPGQPLIEYSQYDWFGNPLHMVYGGKLATSRATNISGKLIGDPAGNTYRYDRSGRVMAFITPTGETKSFRYDDHGQLKATYITSAHSKVEIPIPAESASEKALHETHSDLFPPDVQTHFDARGNLLQVSRSNGTQTLSGSFSYDLEDHLTGVVWPNGSSSKVKYDDRGYIAAEQIEAQKWTRRTFSPDGKILAEKNPAGKIIESSYDSEGRVIRRGSNTFHYVADSDLIDEMKSKDSEIHYEYDFAGRVLAETHRVSLPGETPKEWTIHYERDLSGKILKTIYPDQYVVGFDAGKISTPQETLFRVTQSFGGRPVSYQQGAFSLSEKFEGGHLIEKRISSSGNLSDLSFHYDSSDRPTLIEDRITREKQKYTYSQQGFLTDQVSENHGNETTHWSMSYDSLGNPLSLSGPNGKTEIHYSAASNLPPSHDEAGRVAERDNWLFNYDAEGKMISAQNGAHQLSFGYDSLGRRTFKIADGKITYFVYDEQNRLLLEETPADRKKLRYIYKGHEIIAFQVNREDHETSYSVLSDQRLAPQWLAENGKAGAHPIRLESSPYDPASHSSAANDLHIGTPGQYYDTETGLYYNISRYYDPKTGRYLSPDPTGIFGGANPYLYAKGNPISFIDPLGKTPSDSQIITEQDAEECNQQSGGTPIKPTQTTPINPSLTPLPDEGDVWRVGTNRWNSDLEAQYSQWISTQVDPDFMIKFQIKADCAEAAAIVRAVFSRMYSLPMLITNGKDSVGNSTKTWAHIPTIPFWNPSNWQQNLMNDQRFRQYLTAMSDTINSHVTPLNTYPIKIQDDTNPNTLSKYVQPGTLIVSTDHVEFVKKIDKSQFDPLTKLSGTTGPGYRSLMLEPMDIDYQSEQGRGFVNWDWTVNCGPRGWKHVAASRMPGYDAAHVQNQLNSFDQYNATQLQDQAQQNQQKIDDLSKQLASAHGLSSSQLKQLYNNLEQAKQDKISIANAMTFRQNNPNATIPSNLHDYVQLLAHNGTLPQVNKQDVLNDEQSLVKRIGDRAAIINNGATQAKTETPYQAQEDFATPDRDMNDKARFARDLKMLENQKGKITITENDFTTELANRWVDVGNGAKVNAYFYYMSLLEDYQGNKVSPDLNAPLADRWGCSWVRAEAIPMLEGQLASAKVQAAAAESKYEAYENSQQATQQQAAPSTLSELEAAVSHPVDTFESLVHQMRSPSSAPPNPKQAAQNAQGLVQSVQSQIQLIQTNYGAIPNCLSQ